MEIAVTDEGRKMPGASIKVFKDGSLVENVFTDAKGLADIPCEPNAVYTIEIGGNKGMVTKKLEINTKSVAPETAKGDIFFPVTVGLFEKIDGLNLAILDKPIGKIKFDPEYGDFDSDAAYTKTVQKELEDLEKEFMAKQVAKAAEKAGAMKEYAAAIKIADKAFASEEWEEAAEQYRIAEKVNPDPLETYPSFQLAELKTKLIKIESDNKRYDEAITKAEAALSSKNYEIAIAEFQRALGYKPKEEYPETKIKEVQGILANSVKIEQSYLAAIEKGDNALKINDITTAKAAFQEAVGLKSEETYPQNRISEIDDILAKQDARKAEYDTAIKDANEALAAKAYPVAKASYKKASTLKPTEQYPKDQIERVDALMAGAAKLEQNYLAAVEKGDIALKANNFVEAKTSFQSASTLKPEEAYPKNKVIEIDDFIAKNKAKDKQYLDKIAEADKALESKDYVNAKIAYTTAVSIKPAEAYPATKIAEIDGVLANLAKAEESYKAAIAKGDAAIGSVNYETAKAAFNEALTYKPDEKYPKDKLEEIGTIVLKNKQSEEEYTTAIQDGDDAFADRNYDKAKEFYTAATGLKPTEAYPKDKIAEIEKTVTEAAEKEKAYNDALASADDAMNSNDLEKAKGSYETASGLKPEEGYPKEQIAKIVMQISDSEELNANYAAAITEGDGSMAAKDYEKAKTAFDKASTLKENEEYPKTKISEINGILAELKGKEETYNAAIAKGDAALSSEEYEGARAAFEEAVAIKDEKYPKDKIVEIDAKIKALAEAAAMSKRLEAEYQTAIAEADKFGSERKYDEAISEYTKASELKPEESYPKEKITELGLTKKNEAKAAELAEVKKKYEEQIKTADAAFQAGDLEIARTAYETALAIKGDETYPVEKIASITEILVNDAENDSKYKDAISAADKLMVEKKWEEAKAEYQKAAKVKPDQEFPKEKIVEIDERLAEIAAKQEEIRLQGEKQAEVDANYTAIIADADKFFNSGKFEDSKSKYEAALKIKEEQYPKDKIAEIAAKLVELSDASAAAEAQEKIDAEYDALIVEADALFSSEEYTTAKNKYEAAVAVKEEQYPKDKIAEIAAKLVELADADAANSAAEAQAKIDAKYNALIVEADALFDSEEYTTAKSKYEAAVAVKEQQYPKDRIAAIAAKLVELADADAANSAAEAQAKIDVKYDALIVEADALFDSEEYTTAKSKYEAADAVKEEQYPKDKIAAIAAKLVELADADAANSAAEAQAKIDAKYDALIVEADALFDSEEYTTAKSKYQAAVAVKVEQYPKDKIAAIAAKLVELADVDAANSAAEAQAKIDVAYDAIIVEADALFDSEEYTTAKSKYEAAVAVKEEQYPKDKIAEIEAKLIKLASAESANAAAEAEAKIEKEYNDLIAEADASFERKEFKPAKVSYETALRLKDEQYPKDQITKIASALDALATVKAAGVKEAKIELEYLAAIEKGDNSLTSDDLQNALKAFKKAAALKPNESYPAQKIEEIDSLIAARNGKDAAKQEELKKLYDNYIQEGISAMDAKNWSLAVSSFQEAQNTLPKEALPPIKLKEIKDLKNKQVSEEEEIRLRREQSAANDASYQVAIANGDKYFRDKNYNDAENEYRLALGLKSEEIYPQDQLDEISAIEVAQNAANQAELNAKSAGDKKEQQYKDLIALGDKEFQAEFYQKAKDNFEKALQIKSDEVYPKAQIDLLNNLLEKEKLAEAQRRKDLDKPIRIQKGPKATITDDAEAEIERIYRELWAKQNSDKNAKLEERQADLAKIREENIELEESRKLNAVERLEDIRISMKDQFEASSELNLQNYETVKQQEEDFTVSVQNYMKTAERRRETKVMDKELLAESISLFNKKRAAEIVEGKKEMIENEFDEVYQSNLNKAKRQYDYITDVQSKFEDLESRLQQFHEGKSTEFYPENYKRILKEEEDVAETTEKNAKESEDRRLKYQENANQTSTEIGQYTGANAENYKRVLKDEEGFAEITETNTKESEDRRLKYLDKVNQTSTEIGQYTGANAENYKRVLKDEEGFAETTEKNAKESGDRRLEYQENANQTSTEIRQFAGENAERFKNNQLAIEELEKDLKKENDEFVNASEKRRKKNSEEDYYLGEKKIRQDKSSADYPQGVTEKIIENQNNSTTIRRIVVESTRTDIYEKTLYKWGGIFYTKNGRNITKDMWDSESK
jgi:tetratricopeptide (TPR) repeat protein